MVALRFILNEAVSFQPSAVSKKRSWKLETGKSKLETDEGQPPAFQFPFSNFQFPLKAAG